jgi:peroxiredoxin
VLVLSTLRLMSVEVGSVAPDFTLVDETGEKVTLSRLRGRNVVLIFYPWDFSSTCTRELHQVTELAGRFGDAEVFGISIDSKYAHAAFKRQEGLAVRLLADSNPQGAVARLYGVYLEAASAATRATFVIDKDGVVRYRVVTSISEARDQAEIVRALAACPV